MGKRMNWGRAKRYAQVEEKYADGTVLPNGRQVRHGHHGRLDNRARTAEAQWLFDTGLGTDLNCRRVAAREIYAKRTPAGGWSRAQLAEWGVPWPPPKGWKDALVKGLPMPQRSV